MVGRRFLFVCTGNICRSPMAELFFKKRVEGDDRFEARSAGTHAYLGSPPGEVAAAMQEHGIDASGHSSTQLTSGLVEWADVVVVMEPKQVGIVRDEYGGADKEIVLLDVPDPYGGGLRDYRDCAALIKGRVKGLLEERGE